MELSDVGKELVYLLKEISDDRNFILGCMSNAPSDESWEVMIRFINKAKELGEEVTQDDVLQLSIILSDKRLEQSNQ